MGISNKRMRKKPDVNFINSPKNSAQKDTRNPFYYPRAFIAFYIIYHSFINTQCVRQIIKQLVEILMGQIINPFRCSLKMEKSGLTITL